MKALVVYDSQYGNTERIAQAIGAALAARVETRVVRAADATADTLADCGLLVVGSPTQSFHATKPVDELLKGRSLRGVRAAAFDTRFDMAVVDSRMLRLAVRVAGDNAYAAPRIAAQLAEAGAEVVAEPEGFIVTDTEGPLRAGELERATAWGTSLLATV
ncbi:MAG TPA: flavodoxin domain-containing protein [Promineifilum sp.]|nr:flavodoxin domain-containing protein [Promineifilum sp.]